MNCTSGVSVCLAASCCSVFLPLLLLTYPSSLKLLIFLVSRPRVVVQHQLTSTACIDQSETEICVANCYTVSVIHYAINIDAPCAPRSPAKGRMSFARVSRDTRLLFMFILFFFYTIW
jgi:hypothetical protein